MNVVIVEDERLTAQRLRGLITSYDPAMVVLAELTSVSEAIKWFRAYYSGIRNPGLDLIFMDIHLGDGDCFELIREVNLQLPIIFTTAFDEYMVKAFKVNSVDYLLKPINADELAAAITKFKSVKATYAGETQESTNIQNLITRLTTGKPAEYKDRFMVTLGTKIQSIKTEDIAYFFLEERVVFLVTNDNKTLPVDYSLDKLVQILDSRYFFRINRQYIISLHSIHMVHTLSSSKLKLDLTPKPRHEVTVSLDRATDFKTWLGKD